MREPGSEILRTAAPLLVEVPLFPLAQLRAEAAKASERSPCTRPRSDLERSSTSVLGITPLEPPRFESAGVVFCGSASVLATSLRGRVTASWFLRYRRCPEGHMPRGQASPFLMDGPFLLLRFLVWWTMAFGPLTGGVVHRHRRGWCNLYIFWLLFLRSKCHILRIVAGFYCDE